MLGIVVRVWVGASGPMGLAQDIHPRKDLVRGVLVQRRKATSTPLSGGRAVAHDADLHLCARHMVY